MAATHWKREEPAPHVQPRWAKGRPGAREPRGSTARSGGGPTGGAANVP